MPGYVQAVNNWKTHGVGNENFMVWEKYMGGGGGGGCILEICNQKWSHQIASQVLLCGNSVWPHILNLFSLGGTLGGILVFYNPQLWFASVYGIASLLHHVWVGLSKDVTVEGENTGTHGQRCKIACGMTEGEIIQTHMRERKTGWGRVRVTNTKWVKYTHAYTHTHTHTHTHTYLIACTNTAACACTHTHREKERCFRGCLDLWLVYISKSCVRSSQASCLSDSGNTQTLAEWCWML